MKIALIGGRDYQQFPTLSYGGVETCVENLAWGLYKENESFVCIVPKRTVIKEYPFEIIESSSPPVPGPVDEIWKFASTLPDLVKSVRPDVIWSQSFWSAQVLQTLGIPIICTWHCFVPKGKKPNENWMKNRENTWYRFISNYQMKQWVYNQTLSEKSFMVHTGVADEEYECDTEKEDYFLWVGGLGWGMHPKGLDTFIRLSKKQRNHRFVAYGTGNAKIEEYLKKLSIKSDNFEYKGALNRGPEHRHAFKKAKAFLMLTNIPEPLGRTNFESMTKGTPVISTCNGALPEIVENKISGMLCKNFKEIESALSISFDYKKVFDYSQKFHVRNEIQLLKKYSANIIGGKTFK